MAAPLTPYPFPPGMAIPRLMLQKVLAKHRKDPDTGCWVWTDALNTNGYGVVWDPAKKRQLKAHRVAYEELVGPIPGELPLDHICRNRTCINPAHLEPVTHAENVRRGISPPAQRARQTHCKHGHELSGSNVWVDSNSGHRKCKECGRIKSQKRRKSHPDATAEAKKEYAQRNREKIRAYLKDHYQRNRDARVQYARDKRAAANA